MSDRYEVGYAYRGCSKRDPSIIDRQRDVLERLLEECSTIRSDWAVLPRVIEEHNDGAVVGLGDYGKTLVVPRQDCTWVVLGVTNKRPKNAECLLAAGVRMDIQET